MSSDRPELSSMADNYARHALSQRAAFKATHPAALDTARLFADEPVLRVVDLGAADGVNSHGLIRDLMAERAGRPLTYALVDLPTNAWAVAADHLRHAFGVARDGPGVILTPGLGDAGPVADVGTGVHWESPEAHREACRRALERIPPPAAVISFAGIALEQAPCLPPGTVHIAVSGTAMHWVAQAAGLASTGSVFPGYPDHEDEAERQAWRVTAARQWERMLEMRAIELAPGGRLIAALPASPAPDPERTGLYVEIIGDMNRMLSDWCRAGRIGAATVAAVVVPVWMRTLDEIRAPSRRTAGSSPASSSRAPSSSVSITPTGMTIPACSREATSGASTAWADRSSSVHSRSRARTAPALSSPSSWPSSRSASRRPPTDTAGTTSRPWSSAGRRTARRSRMLTRDPLASVDPLHRRRRRRHRPPRRGECRIPAGATTAGTRD